MDLAPASLEPPVVTFKKRNVKSKATIRKKTATPPPDDSASDSSFTSSEDEGGRPIKRRRTTAAVSASTAQRSQPRETPVETSSSAAAVAAPTAQDDATKASNWYDEKWENNGERGAPGIRPSSDTSGAAGAPGMYKGAANYQSFVTKNPDRAARQVGPLKASTNVRTITVTDFAPDVCKDYKQTGFCGFGDNCKFLHAREDYKQGWQLDRDWEIDTKGKKMVGKTVASANRNGPSAPDDDDDAALLESIPFACIICRQSYTQPVVTKCGHYFCEGCALKRYRKDPSCAACGTGTGGVFNVAKKLTRLLEKKRRREEEKKALAAESGEVVS